MCFDWYGGGSLDGVVAISITGFGLWLLRRLKYFFFIWYQRVQWVDLSDFSCLVLCMKFWFRLFWLYYSVVCILLQSDYCLGLSLG